MPADDDRRKKANPICTEKENHKQPDTSRVKIGKTAVEYVEERAYRSSAGKISKPTWR